VVVCQVVEISLSFKSIFLFLLTAVKKLPFLMSGRAIRPFVFLVNRLEYAAFLLYELKIRLGKGCFVKQ